MLDEARKIARLKNEARARAYSTEAALGAIEELGALRHPHAIRALAMLLKLPDPRGEAAMYMLIERGIEVEDVMLESLESRDADRAERAQQVLSAIHHEYLTPYDIS